MIFNEYILYKLANIGNYFRGYFTDINDKEEIMTNDCEIAKMEKEEENGNYEDYVLPDSQSRDETKNAIDDALNGNNKSNPIYEYDRCVMLAIRDQIGDVPLKPQVAKAIEQCRSFIEPNKRPRIVVSQQKLSYSFSAFDKAKPKPKSWAVQPCETTSRLVKERMMNILSKKSDFINYGQLVKEYSEQYDQYLNVKNIFHCSTANFFFGEMRDVVETKMEGNLIFIKARQAANTTATHTFVQSRPITPQLPFSRVVKQTTSLPLFPATTNQLNHKNTEEEQPFNVEAQMAMMVAQRVLNPSGTGQKSVPKKQMISEQVDDCFARLDAYKNPLPNDSFVQCLPQSQLRSLTSHVTHVDASQVEEADDDLIVSLNQELEDLLQNQQQKESMSWDEVDQELLELEFEL